MHQLIGQNIKYIGEKGMDWHCEQTWPICKPGHYKRMGGKAEGLKWYGKPSAVMVTFWLVYDKEMFVLHDNPAVNLHLHVVVQKTVRPRKPEDLNVSLTTSIKITLTLCEPHKIIPFIKFKWSFPPAYPTELGNHRRTHMRKYLVKHTALY